MRIVKTAIVGMGFIGQVHLESVRRLGYVEVSWIVLSPRADAADIAAAAEKYALPKERITNDYRTVLADKDVEAVHICTPNKTHFAMIKEAIAAGKHVLSEKPLAMNREESGELMRLAAESCLLCAVNFNYRQYALVQHMRAKIRAGELGDIFAVHGNYLQDWLLYKDDYNWRVDENEGGSLRALGDIGSHWLDLVQYVLDDEITAVCADKQTVHPVRVNDMRQTFAAASGDGKEVKVNTEDFSMVMFRTKKGTRGVCTISQVSAGRKNHLSFEIDGAEQSFAWNQEEPQKLWIGHRGRANEVMLADSTLLADAAKAYLRHPSGHNEGWVDGNRNSMANFYQHLCIGSPCDEKEMPFATFADGHRIMCVLDAVAKSCESGEWCEVNYTIINN